MEIIDLKNCINLRNRYNEFFATQLKVGAAVFKKCGDNYRLLKISKILSKNTSSNDFEKMDKDVLGDNFAKYLTAEDEYLVDRKSVV